VDIKLAIGLVKMRGLEIVRSSHLLWRLRMRRAISPLPIMPSWNAA